jgi:hypothetical protein
LLLQQLRQDLGGRDQKRTRHKHDDEASAELPPGQHSDIDQRLLAIELPGDENQQGRG